MAVGLHVSNLYCFKALSLLKLMH